MAETRITAGDWRGRVVFTNATASLRPTTSRVREALFNILGPSVRGARVVDLYAGAGTVGFEALSRGAARVTFVERDVSASRLIRRSAEHLGCTDRVEVVSGDAKSWVARHHAAADADICYLDAPYLDDGVEGVLEELGRRAPKLVVCEHHRSRVLPDGVGTLARERIAAYGLTRLSFYRRGLSEIAGEDRS